MSKENGFAEIIIRWPRQSYVLAKLVIVFLSYNRETRRRTRDIDKTAAILEELSEQYMDDSVIIDGYSRTQGLSPLDCLVEREKTSAVLGIYRAIAKVLTSAELEIFIGWVIDGNTYTEIGRELRRPSAKLVIRSKSKKSREIVRKAENNIGNNCIRRILKKIKGITDTDDILYMYGEITDNPSELEAHTPQIQLGWPHAFLKESNGGSYWTKPTKAAKKKSEYKPRVVCKIPEYLQGCFGDDMTRCSLCGRHCTRKKNNRGVDVKHE
jgi:hypothetical protein